MGWGLRLNFYGSRNFRWFPLWRRRRLRDLPPRLQMKRFVLFLLLVTVARADYPNDASVSAFASGPTWGLYWHIARASPTTVVITNNSFWSNAGESSVNVTVQGVARDQIRWTENGNGTQYTYTITNESTVDVSIQYSPTVTLGAGAAAPTVYGHTYNITDPEGGMYYVVQDGVIIANKQIPAGGGAFTVSSPSDSNFQLFKIVGGEYVTGQTSGADGAGIWITGDTVVKSQGLTFPTSTPSSTPVTVTPGAGSTPGNSTPIPSGNGSGTGTKTPANPTPVTPGPAAPTPTTPAPVPSTPSVTPTAPGVTPNAAPDATVGQAANTIKDAVDKNTAAAVDSASKTITAIDKTTAKVAETGAATVDVLNKQLNSNFQQSGAQLTATNKTNSALDMVNAKLDVSNRDRAASETVRAQQATTANNLLGNVDAKLTTINSTLAANAEAQRIRDQTRDAKIDEVKTAIEDKESVVDAYVKGQASYTPTANLGEAQSKAGEVATSSAAGWSKPSSSSVALTGAASGTGVGTATVRVAAVDVKLSLSLEDYFPNAHNLLTSGRALILIALGVWFVRSCSSTLETYVAALGNARAGGGVVGPENVVPAVGLAKHFAGTGAIVVAIAAGCAACVALVDTLGAVAGVSITSLFGAVNMAAIGGFYSFLDQYYPVAASVSLVVLRAGFGYLIAPIYLAASAAARFLSI